jgi:hypothetical protein
MEENTARRGKREIRGMRLRKISESEHEFTPEKWKKTL